MENMRLTQAERALLNEAERIRCEMRLCGGKLVRDKIPEIIEASGRKPVTETVCGGEYLKALNAKLLEETKEYLESGEAEELADICEVVCAILSHMGMERDAFEAVREAKRLRNGGFEEGIILKEIIG